MRIQTVQNAPVYYGGGTRLRPGAPCLDFRPEEDMVVKVDLQDLGERIEGLAEKVESLRRFL